MSLVTFNHNTIAALDIETTGSFAGYHEIIQIAIVPMDEDLEIMDVSPFNMFIKPEHPERAQRDATRAHGISLDSLENHPSKEQVADALEEWFVNLHLPMDKRLIYLTQNGLFDIPFCKCWLGETRFDRYFCWIGRDTMQFASGLNDQAAFKCQPVPFSGVGLKSLANTLGVELLNHHDALADAITTAKVYKELLRLEL